MDQKLFLLINTVWTNPALDRLMAVASSLDFWIPFFLLGAVVIAWRGGFRARSFLVVALLAAAISDGAISNPLKHLVNRPRPGDAMAGVRVVDLAAARPRVLAAFKKLKVRISAPPQASATTGGRSFPSSHTSNTMAVATVAAAFYRRRGWWAFAPALLVAYSRIYTGAHRPSDVAGSIILGAVVGFITVLLARKAWRVWSPRFVPTLATHHPDLLDSHPSSSA